MKNKLFDKLMTVLLMVIRITGLLAMVLVFVGMICGGSKEFIIGHWVTFISCTILYVMLKITQMSIQTKRYIKKYLEETDNEKQK